MNNVSKIKQRNSNIEILRIVAMIMIVAHHCSIHGIGRSEILSLKNQIALDLLGGWGKLGVVLFVLISGYYLCEQIVNKDKIISICEQVWVYSFLLTAVSKIKLGGDISFSNILMSIFPVNYGMYWFATAYVVLLVLSPYVNKFFELLSKDDIKKLLSTLLIIWFVLPTILTGTTLGVTTNSFAVNDVGLFITIYLIGALIRKGKVNILLSKGWVTAALFTVACLSIVSMDCLGYYYNINILINRSSYFTQINSLLTILIAVAFFSFCISRKSFNNQFVNRIASLMFGVYLFHDHPIFSSIWWHDILKLDVNSISWIRITIALFVTIIIGALIESLRKLIANIISEILPTEKMKHTKDNS